MTSTSIFAGYTGDPFVSCRQFTQEDLCSPNPCGQNAVCRPGSDRSGNDKPVCTCPSGHRGDPLVSCRRGTNCRKLVLIYKHPKSSVYNMLLHVISSPFLQCFSVEINFIFNFKIVFGITIFGSLPLEQMYWVLYCTRIAFLASVKI
jgi:hypothetical protein